MSVTAWSESYFPAENLRYCISAIIDLSDKKKSLVWHHLRLPDDSVISIPDFEDLATSPSKYDLNGQQSVSFETTLKCENDETIAEFAEVQLPPDGPGTVEVGLLSVTLEVGSEFAKCSIASVTSSLAGLFSGSKSFQETLSSIHGASDGVFGRVTFDTDEGPGHDLETISSSDDSNEELPYGEVFENETIDEIVQSYQRWEKTRA